MQRNRIAAYRLCRPVRHDRGSNHPAVRSGAVARADTTRHHRTTTVGIDTPFASAGRHPAPHGLDGIHE
jgi:hypothetical protein